MSQTSPPIETTPEEQLQQQQQHSHPVKKKQQQAGGYRDERQNYHQQRPQYRRQNRPVYVEDLREKLNRKRREKDEVKLKKKMVFAAFLCGCPQKREIKIIIANCC